MDPGYLNCGPRITVDVHTLVLPNGVAHTFLPPSIAVAREVAELVVVHRHAAVRGTHERAHLLACSSRDRTGDVTRPRCRTLADTTTLLSCIAPLKFIWCDPSCITLGYPIAGVEAAHCRIPKQQQSPAVVPFRKCRELRDSHKSHADHTQVTAQANLQRKTWSHFLALLHC